MNRRKIRRERVENWIRMNKEILKIKAIEREVNIPTNTIQKFIKNDVSINTRRITRIHKWILKISTGNDLEWIYTNYKYFNINAIEREIGTSKGMIQKSIKYGRHLNNDVVSSLIKWQNNLLDPIEEWKEENKE